MYLQLTSFLEYNIICFFKFSLERDQNLSLLDYPFFLDPTSKVFYIVPDTFYNLSSLPPSFSSPHPFPHSPFPPFCGRSVGFLTEEFSYKLS